MSVRALVALGSNVGDRLTTLEAAVDRLDAVEGVRFVRSSRVYETDPVGPPQPDFLNAVVEIETELAPRDLLSALQSIEADLGRTRDLRWGPRTIDLDLLVYDEESIAEPDLEVPHPRMHERAFVLLPLLELDADPMLPGGRRVATLRLGPDAVGGAAPFAPPLRPGR
jgi:2-amino-4-hydroxy-6-hydroxymethyldihydropteridine diphosphokinase